MLIASALAIALAAGVQAGSFEAANPTAIERGLVDRACKGSSEQPDVNETCRAEKLTAMRGDFGKDLAKVAAADRTKIDETCTPLLEDAALKGRAPYLDCMVQQLTALSKGRRKGGNAFAATMAATAAETPAEAAPAPVARASSGLPMPVMIGAAVGVIAVGGGIAFVAMRSKKPAVAARTGKCRQCGAASPDSDLCANCRRAAAEALRRANAERIEAQKKMAEEAKREQQREAARLEQQKHREAEERRVREYEEMREREHAAKIEEAVATNAPEPPPPPSAYDAEAFDPYVILGVAPDASADVIKKAYEAAKKKYDPDLVAHLSEEVQQHYREKSQAVDKAFEVIGGGSQPA